MPHRRRRKFLQLIEQLEPRALLHGDGGFYAAINFQPAGAPVPDGYLVDSGLAFGDRGNGLSYGWNADDTATARDRNSKLSPDQRYDTLIHMQRNGSFRWSLAVPNGIYNVHLVSGDAIAFDSNFCIKVENVVLMNA